MQALVAMASDDSDTDDRDYFCFIWKRGSVFYIHSFTNIVGYWRWCRNGLSPFADDRRWQSWCVCSQKLKLYMSKWYSFSFPISLFLSHCIFQCQYIFENILIIFFIYFSFVHACILTHQCIVISVLKWILICFWLFVCICHC